jgi:prepilin signal peptidase PulO-like enzyme (type II secretory pathway)
LKITVELPIILSSIVALVAAYNDAKRMLIPNWLTITTIAAGLIFALWTGSYENLPGALLVFGVMLYFWSRGWIGGGDAKLAPGLALFLGAIPVLYGIALACAVFALWGAAKAWRNSGVVTIMRNCRPSSLSVSMSASSPSTSRAGLTFSTITLSGEKSRRRRIVS